MVGYEKGWEIGARDDLCSTKQCVLVEVIAPANLKTELIASNVSLSRPLKSEDVTVPLSSYRNT